MIGSPHARHEHRFPKGTGANPLVLRLSDRCPNVRPAHRLIASRNGDMLVAMDWRAEYKRDVDRGGPFFSGDTIILVGARRRHQ